MSKVEISYTPRGRDGYPLYDGATVNVTFNVPEDASLEIIAKHAKAAGVPARACANWHWGEGSYRGTLFGQGSCCWPMTSGIVKE